MYSAHGLGHIASSKTQHPVHFSQELGVVFIPRLAFEAQRQAPPEPATTAKPLNSELLGTARVTPVFLLVSGPRLLLPAF